jgi:hypothetical protein
MNGKIRRRFPPCIFAGRAGMIRTSIAQAEGFAQEDFKIDRRSYPISGAFPSFYKKGGKSEKGD